MDQALQAPQRGKSSKCVDREGSSLDQHFHDNLNFRIDEACQTGATFVKLYYDRLDSKRQTIGKMYLAGATLAWNGNKIDGRIDSIQLFIIFHCTEDRKHPLNN